MNIFMVVVFLMAMAVNQSSAKPGFLFAASQQTSTNVVRDAFGNQATSYAYQDGHSSAVAVSRNDISKHLAYVAPAPLIYSAPVYRHAPTPVVYSPSQIYYYT